MDSLAYHKIADNKKDLTGGPLRWSPLDYSDLVVHYSALFCCCFPYMRRQAEVALYPKKAIQCSGGIFHAAIDDAINPWPGRSMIKGYNRAVQKMPKYKNTPR